MALNALKSSNLEQLALKELSCTLVKPQEQGIVCTHVHLCVFVSVCRSRQNN